MLLKIVRQGIAKASLQDNSQQGVAGNDINCLSTKINAVYREPVPELRKRMEYVQTLGGAN